MYFFRLILVIATAFFINACGESESSTSAVQSASINIDIGEDQRIKVNDTLSIEAKEVPNDENVSSYFWKYKGNILATTRSFTYTPTSLGVNVLDFSVLYNSGLEVSDSINVIVTTTDVNITIVPISESLSEEYVNAINKARTEVQDCGSKGVFVATTPIIWNEKLYKASYEHIQDLISSQTFSHNGSGTESDWSGYTLGKSSTQIERVENYGYIWARLGENLGGGTLMDTTDKIVQAWLESDRHCENLMNPLFKELGMVMLKEDNSLYTYYWGQNFGTAQ